MNRSHRRRFSVLLALAAPVLSAAALGRAFAADVVAAPHWSLVKPVRPAEPEVKDSAWIRNPIDRFVLARLEKEGVAPAAEAAKETLLRRAALDLTGLPLGPAEVDAFAADASPDAYEKQVERLLASPHYGERQARHWLDAARYADSNGYSHDGPRTIWPYRDWVINAINKDMPFDQFTIEQLAGDLLPGATLDQRIATGFHRNTQINTEGGVDPEQFRIEAVLDRVGTTGTVFLGLTVACAQCHDHKYDPISQKEFYRFFAFLNNADEPELRLGGPGEEQRRSRIGALEAELKQLDESLAAKAAEWEKTLDDEARAKLKPEVREALAAPADKRDEKQQKTILAAFKARDAEYDKRRDELKALKKQNDAAPSTLIMAERGEPRPTHLFIKGDFTRLGEPMMPGVLAALHPLNAQKPTRLDLARWIVHPDSPLTARVIVNRIWQQYFGRGIVATENDFGTQGEEPTHPQLLDWLATELLRQDWNTKAIHRLIVTSATYRQGSAVRPELATLDPANRLLARQSRLRLDAEIVRDVSLAASGLLSRKIGGPGVFPPQPAGVLDLGQVKHEWKLSTGEDRYRRGMYTFFFRASPHPLLGSFDAPDATSTCTHRLRSNTPLQALTLLNDEAFVEFAQAMAARTLKEGGPDDASKLTHAFRLCAGRTPSADEKDSLQKLLGGQLAAFRAAPQEAAELSAGKCPQGVGPEQFAAWTIVSRVLLNLDETITRERASRRRRSVIGRAPDGPHVPRFRKVRPCRHAAKRGARGERVRTAWCILEASGRCLPGVV